MKIIIIGAGIAGLTLAAACQRLGIQVKIYDKTKQLRHIGGGLLLWPYAQRYLEWLGLADDITAYRVSIKGCKIFNHLRETIFNEEYAHLYSLLGGEILPINRHLLQQALLAQLDYNTVHLGKTCVEIRSEKEVPQVFFADGTKDSADLIVGADGIHSMVRNSFNKNAIIHYTNHCWWGGMVEQKYVPQLPKDEVFMAAGVGKICIVWPTYGNQFMWYLPVKMSLNDFNHGINNDEKLKMIGANWSVEVQQIISAPPISQSFYLPIYNLSPQSTWSTSCTTLIGDAAHALGPILGQGANQAIEDVFVLVNCLKNSPQNISAALQHYEKLRHEKSERLHQLENQSADTLIHENLESLAMFQNQIKNVNLATFYQDLIPLVDEKYCLTLASMLNAERNLKLTVME